MSINPLLNKLGYSNNDRILIIHADDIGMCHASIAAYYELVESSILSSASTMVPCGWFPATAEFCKYSKHPVDMGVHLTFTNEYKKLRWRPISTTDNNSGLIDDTGYFYHTCKEFHDNAKIEYVQQEMQAQIDLAINYGIDVTHIDSHCGAIFSGIYGKEYVKIAVKNEIPALFIRPDAVLNLEIETEDISEEVIEILLGLEDSGFPMLDAAPIMPLNASKNRIEIAKRLIDDLPIGVSCFILHPSISTTELQTITDDWESRVADYNLLLNENFNKLINQAGINVIGWDIIRKLMRNSISNIKEYISK